ncbi:MAG: extracellular solute-binding protein [Chloroflexi bacterium]|nr:extracellular solute-binding protein [Chloroflexota bacterium]
MSLTRRQLLSWATTCLAGAIGGTMALACRSRFVEVSPIVPVTRPPTRPPQTSVPPASPTLPPIERPTPTPSPASPSERRIIADVTAYGWSEFAMARTSEFEARFPGVRMHWRSVLPWPAYLARVDVLQASGDPPDLLEAPFGVVLTHWLRRRVIRPLGEVAQAQALPVEGLFRSALQACSVDGKLAGIPFLANPGEALLIYEPNALAHAQADLPRDHWGLQDLVQAAAAVQERERGPFGLVPRHDMPGAIALLHLFGANLISLEGRRCTLNSPEGIECLEWLRSLIYDLRAAPAPWQMERGAMDMLRRGKLAMLRGSLVDLIKGRALLSEGVAASARTLRATLFPAHPKTGQRATLANGMAYCLGGRSRVGAEVLQWIEFMIEPAQGATMFLEGYAEPGAGIDSWTDRRVLQQEPLCAALAALADVAQVEQRPWNEASAACYAAWQRNVLALLAGRLDPATAADHICRQIELILRQPPAERLVSP